ncbi:uncharacterized protein ACBT44_000169 isoform 1-T3 [Syngnathus typhle]
MEICVTDPETCYKTTYGGDQEVPTGSQISPEALNPAAEKHKETQQTELKRTAWSPSFVWRPLKQTHTPFWEASKPEPLAMCTRPIRLGLAKLAKPNSVRRFHPYK